MWDFCLKMCAQHSYRTYQILRKIKLTTRRETTDCVTGGTRKPDLVQHFNKPVLLILIVLIPTVCAPFGWVAPVKSSGSRTRAMWGKSKIGDFCWVALEKHLYLSHFWVKLNATFTVLLLFDCTTRKCTQPKTQKKTCPKPFQEDPVREKAPLNFSLILDLISGPN